MHWMLVYGHYGKLYRTLEMLMLWLIKRMYPNRGEVRGKRVRKVVDGWCVAVRVSVGMMIVRVV
jgi:hypothetical protein